MSTYTQILYQIVFGSKDYTNFLTKVNQDILYNYIAGILWNKYVKNQENHHKKVSFKEELIALFKEHGIEFNEKYLLT